MCSAEVSHFCASEFLWEPLGAIAHDRLSNRPMHGKHGTCRFCPFPFLLSKLLGYTCKLVPKSSLFLYLAMESSWGWAPRSNYHNIKVPQSKLIIWLPWLTCPIRIYQLILTQTSPFLLKNPVLQKHLMPSMPDKEAAPPTPYRLRNLFCVENLVSVCVLSWL